METLIAKIKDNFKNTKSKTVSQSDLSNLLTDQIKNTIEKGLNKIDDSALYKQFLLQNSKSQLTNLSNDISKKIISTSKYSELGITRDATGNYSFGKANSESSMGIQIEDSFIKDKKKLITDAENKFIKEYNQDFKTFKQNNKNNSRQQFNTNIQNFANTISTKYQDLLDSYDNVLQQVDTKYENTPTEELKNFKQQIQKKQEKLQSEQDNKIEQAINQCKKIRSKYETISISDESGSHDAKIQVVKQFNGGKIGKIAGDDQYSLIDNNGKIKAKLDSYDEFKIYNDLQCFRIISEGKKYIYPIDDLNTSLQNAFIVNTSKANDDFTQDYFVLSNNGKYEIRKISDGIKGTPIETYNDYTELSDKIKNWGVTTSSSSSTTSTASFKLSDYNRASDKGAYLDRISETEINIPIAEYTSLKKKDIDNLNNLIKSKGKKLILSKRNIRISRKNRHLSLQQIALNSIFNRLK